MESKNLIPTKAAAATEVVATRVTKAVARDIAVIARARKTTRAQVIATLVGGAAAGWKRANNRAYRRAVSEMADQAPAPEVAEA